MDLNGGWVWGAGLEACVPSFFYAAIQIVPSVFLVASSLVSAFAKAGAGEGLGMRLRFLNELLLNEIAK